MKKRMIAALCAMAMIFCLAACSSAPSSAPNNDPAPAADPTPASTADPAPDAEPADEGGPGIAGTAGNPHIITFGTTAPASTDPNNSINLAVAELNNKLMELSGGTLGFEMVFGGVYGSTAQHLAQIKAGTLDGMTSGFDIATNLQGTEAFNAVAMPFVFDSDEHMDKFLASDLWAEMCDKMREENGIMITGLFMHQPPRILNTTNEVVHPEDVRGFKLRVPESDVQVRVWTGAGASPVQIPVTELYSSLDTGICDGQENDICGSVAMKMYEVAPYFAEIDYIRQAQFLYTSEITWNKMSAQEREWWKEALASACEVGTNAYTERYTLAIQQINENGGHLTEFDYDEWKEFFTKIVKEEFDGVLFPAGLYDEIQAMA